MSGATIPAASAKPGQYEVGKPGSKCSICQRDIPVGEPIMAALREIPTGFDRLDIDPQCWNDFDRQGVIAYWQTIVPQPSAKKKLFVDDQVLCELFERLAGTEDPGKLSFRFVLGLILMRKRLVIYESSRVVDQKEIWTVRLKGKDQRLELLDPKLNEQQVTDVSRQLGEILNEEL